MTTSASTANRNSAMTHPTNSAGNIPGMVRAMSEDDDTTTSEHNSDNSNNDNNDTSISASSDTEDFKPYRRTDTMQELCRVDQQSHHLILPGSEDDGDNNLSNDINRELEMLILPDKTKSSSRNTKRRNSGNLPVKTSKVFNTDSITSPSNIEDEIVAELARRAKMRQMTSSQEVWNAITMLPVILYTFYYVFYGKWVLQADIDAATEATQDGTDTAFSFSHDSMGETTKFTTLMQALLADENGCVQSSNFPRVFAIPPATILFVAAAFFIHTPISVYYHLLCAFKLPAGPKRMDHWARRLDQALIHVMSGLLAYGTSGNWDFFLAVTAFNLDCIYRLFQKGIHKPRRILIRMMIAFLSPALPVLVRGDFMTFLQIITIDALAGWLFAAYPFGGWSHGVFHLVAFINNPIYLHLSSQLWASREQVKLAAACAVYGGN